MGDFFSVVFGIIWIIVIITAISSVSKKARQANRPVQTQQRPTQAPPVYDAQQTRLDSMKRLDNKSSSKSAGQVYGTGAFAKTANPGKISSSKIEKSFGSRVTGTLGENAVLLEDRRNDWLAKQLREEAAIKKRGSVYDLGATHDVNCDAGDLKKSHIKRHNTNGVNREMFR